MDTDEEVILDVPMAISPDAGYGFTFRDAISDYSLAAVADCLAKLCERFAGRNGEAAQLKGEQKTAAKQWTFAQHRFERLTRDLLECGPGSECK